MTSDPQSRPWHSLPVDEVRAALDTDIHSGLSADEARRRLARFGPNRLRAKERESLLAMYLEELREPMILLLLFTGVLYSLWGELSDTLTIFFVIITLVSVEVFNDRRADRAIDSLKELAEPTAPVRRGGETLEAPAAEIVPGDVVLLLAGRRVPADGRLIESYSLAADESPLTGESVPVDKAADATLPAGAALVERSNLVFAGTTITRGRGAAIVTATGMAGEIGRVAQLAQEVKAPRTPLQQVMNELTRTLVWLALAFSVVVPLLGWLWSGQPLQQMILTGLALAFSVIPEEMPIIITMVLALGAYRLAQRHAIVKDLKAVETLGAITVIATDKTGTLTQNRLSVKRVYPEAQARRLLELGALCNDAAAGAGHFTGDPLDVALVQAAHDAGLNVDALRQAHPLRGEFTFDNTRKLMSVVYDTPDGPQSAVKGAPEAVLARAVAQPGEAGAQPLSDADRQAALETATRMAGDGLRVIALAERAMPAGPAAQSDAEAGLTFAGLLGLADPPRPEARGAIAGCRTAGIRTILVTGDHPLTARAIAQQVGLDADAGLLTGGELDGLSGEALAQALAHISIYARTTPEHKLRIIRALQARGERVAATGDGVNDAPALAAADIGVAMGETGTDVAREAAAMVLADDNFITIVNAVQEGRVLYANLRKGVRYYLACKVALVAAMLLPVLLRVPVPFAPVQIIIMELFMDLAASATFVAEPAEANLMQQRPRDPRAAFMDRAMLGSIFGSAAGLFAAVSAAYLITYFSGAGLVAAQTIAFGTWLLGHVLLAINLRSERQPLFRLGIFSNRLMNLWAVAVVAFLILISLLPALQAALKVTSPGAGAWGLAVAAAIAGTCWMEARKLVGAQRAPLL